MTKKKAQKRQSARAGPGSTATSTENVGTYMNSHGRMVFDVNDFDEAYIGHFSWDPRRFVASLALMGWQKALPDESVRNLVGRYLRAYLAQVTHQNEIDDPDVEEARPRSVLRGP